MFVSEKRFGRIERRVSKRQHGLTVVLEDIHDPHNTQAVMRSCDAFGVQNVQFIFENYLPYEIKNSATSSSGTASKWLTVHESESTLKTLRPLKRQEYIIIAAVIDDEAEDVYQCRFDEENIRLN